jgi:hypothetical protein
MKRPLISLGFAAVGAIMGALDADSSPFSGAYLAWSFFYGFVLIWGLTRWLGLSVSLKWLDRFLSGGNDTRKTTGTFDSTTYRLQKASGYRGLGLKFLIFVLHISFAATVGVFGGAAFMLGWDLYRHSKGKEPWDGRRPRKLQ